MKTVCELNMCNGCMACVEKCHRNAITIKDDLKYYNALIDTKKCVDCGLCTKVCPRENDNDMSKPKWWYQGWADSEIREHASSGGAASAIIRAFIKNGGYVASCLFDSGKFVFEVTNEMAVARKFAGSKYVKSNPEKIYGKIQSLLKANQKVLFIGLPCQVAAVNQFIKDKTKIKPLILGGGQQRAMRSGTENVPGIAGLGKAAELIYTKDFDEKVDKMYELRDYFVSELEKLDGVHINGMRGRESAPHVVSAGFEGVRAEVLLHALEDKNIYVSSGSACSSNKPGLSSTLVAIGTKKELLDSTIRFSFCFETTKEQLDYTLEALKELLPVLRKYKRM